MRSATLVVVCLVALAAAASGTAAGDSGVVASVTDGDTLRLTDGRRVRLVQVDTPELGGGECYSRAARTQLLQLAGPGTRVRLTTDPRLDRVDRYGRLLAYVEVGRTNVNVELVRRGAATVYFYRGERGTHAARLLSAGNAARAARRGLWGACPNAVWNPEGAATTGSSGPTRVAEAATARPAGKLRLLLPGRLHPPVRPGGRSRLRGRPLPQLPRARTRSARLRRPGRRRARLRGLTVADRRRRSVHEDQVRDPTRMADRVLHREYASPGVSEHGDRLQAEVAPHSVEVVDLRPNRDIVGLHAVRRPAATALVVVDEAERVCEPVELREEVGVVEVGPAVDDDDRRAVADVAAEQPVWGTSCARPRRRSRPSRSARCRRGCPSPRALPSSPVRFRRSRR